MRARTFTESGRRAQIVRAAIAVIAEAGYLKASFSRIAKHAGLSSTGMISYHFAGKDDLLAACVTEIEEITGAFMQPRIDAAVGHVAQLRAYVEANVDLVGEHPAEVRALIDLIKNAGSRSDAVNGRLALFEEHFRTGQAAGAFGTFDARTAALSFTSGLDAVVATAAADVPEPAELARIGRELADLYVRATAPESTGESE
ncbi:TetR/AcrR family transcriptional regulator [Amycolatopsis mediterranei]|nr:TetR/AcrR family transcriptional regulator [Amycolatopsis mediterranei]KDO08404.1 TetR family transcriptional regulator [Amycolatopsis mediterranei]KDU85488.1 TetR family transcriptional regulator [Amycolatopsis mediterranei]UZF68958.1 TetR family transcriptional regulator [Amycolatopsis mediterranei]